MPAIKRPTKVTLEGHGDLTLRTADYVTEGGEGAIYRKGNHIIKLYHDPQKMQQDNMPEKVRLLGSSLTHPSIVTPKGLVIGSKGAIGYYMPYVTGEAYPRLFTNDFRNQNGIDTPGVTHLATKMHEVVGYAHGQGALLVDANELNWLADIKDVRQPTPYVIDVDSWQIDRFKASVIMPSIRDWHGSISEASDWFSWGIVTFLLYTGIHPYKGKLDGYKPGELEQRMKDNASVFVPGVRLNKAVRDFGIIPGPLLDWYQATFTQGERTLPPSPQATGKANTNLGQIMRVVTTQSGGLIFERLLEVHGEQVVSIWPCGVVRTNAGTLVDVATKRTIRQTSSGRVAVVSRDNGWVIVEEHNGNWLWRFVSRQGTESMLSVPLTATTVLRSGERLFAVTESELIELTLQAFSKPVLTLGNRWQILGKSTRWFSEVGISDVLGAMHLIAPYGADAVAMVRTAELDGLTVVNAKAGTRFVVVVTVNQNGEYEEHRFAFDKNWKQYQYDRELVDGPELNLTILPKGVTASIKDDGELIIAVPFQGDKKVVSDKDIGTNLRLAHIGDKVVYRKDGALWQLRMR
ncbi:MAG: serine/threonine protein kinase [Candidatus Kaiserbacteria bacterium]|nr:serine/threonine protein kinase [Candidatus Kaiserbacteria bacterium]MCB9816644.1 serine/threonine protein kinase [Candidatus Nomurabacteria bacterium]